MWERQECLRCELLVERVKRIPGLSCCLETLASLVLLREATASQVPAVAFESQKRFEEAELKS